MNRGILLALGMLAAVSPAQNLVFLRPAAKLDIQVGKLTEHAYALTRSEPIEFAATGPVWLRVYTRLRWHEDMTGTENYELVLRRQDSTRHVNLQAELSSATRGPDSEGYARWRSFFVYVKRGEQKYRLELAAANSDTVAVRITFENPPAWKEVAPVIPLPTRRLRQDSVELSCYLVSDSGEVGLKLVGPLSLMVETRLNYRPGESGKRSFGVSVSADGLQVKSEKFDVLRARIAHYLDDAGKLPSISRRVRFDLPAGEHDVSILFRAGKGRSGTMRFLTRERSGRR